VRPFGRESRIRLDGGLDYLYFAKTDSQRKLNGYGTAQLDLVGVKTRLFVEEHYQTFYGRPSFEVNERVQHETEGTRGFLRRNLGDRYALALLGERERTTTDSQNYLGTDLGDTLTEDTYRAGGELRIALSVKTQLVVGVSRSGIATRGCRSATATRRRRTGVSARTRPPSSSGRRSRATSGSDWTRGRAQRPLRERRRGLEDLFQDQAGCAVRARHRLLGLCDDGTDAHYLNETAEVYLDKVLVSNLYFRLFGRIATLASDGAITIVTPDGIETAVRDDRVREAGAEFGYQFRTRVRIGVTATYTTRESPFETFGVEGLLAGLTVQYNPPQPSFR